MEKIKLSGEEGPTLNFKRIHDTTQKLQDDANKKAALLTAVKQLPKALFVKNGFTETDIKLFYRDLVANVFKHALVNKPSALRELAVESLRETMVKLEIEKPGFRDDFLESLDEAMRVNTHHA